MTLPVSSFTILLGGGIVAAIGLLRVVWRYQGKLVRNGTTPGLRLVISNTRRILLVLPAFRIPFTSNWVFNLGAGWWMKHNHDVFEKYGQDIISTVSVDGAPNCYLIADAEATRFVYHATGILSLISRQEVMGNRHRFVKPVYSYEILNVFGRNVITTEGEEWRMHRKITAPSFTENSNKLVCEETILAMRGLLEIWGNKDSVEHKNFTDVAVQLALIVICGAAFGMRVPWSGDIPATGHQLGFKTAIELASEGLLTKLSVPGFAMNLTEHWSRIALAFVELRKYIREMIHDRADNYKGYSDLFSNLLAANDNDSEGLKLTDDEVMGNIFIFLLAGHETTAHTLSYGVAFLALYPEVQEKLYNHVKEKVADPSGAPTYHEIPTLTYTAAVFSETLWHFPPIIVIPRGAAEDTLLKTVNKQGESVVVPVEKGAFIHILPTALHHNPRYWPNPEQFKPERFLGDWPRNAYMPFSTGLRSCMGRRFAEIEGIIVLSMLVRNYRITITEDPKFAGETFDQRKARIFASYNLITLTPYKVPVTFTLRR